MNVSWDTSIQPTVTTVSCMRIACLGESHRLNRLPLLTAEDSLKHENQLKQLLLEALTAFLDTAELCSGDHEES